MMVRHALVVALVAATAITPAVAASEPSATKAAEPVKEKKICRRDLATGSILPKSICRTKDEWAAIDAANQHSLERDRAAAGSRAMTGSNR